MATFKPLAPPEPLPATGTIIEHATVDAKERANLTKTFHLAKDIAAFANHLGGNLLIGIPEVAGVLGAPKPISNADASLARNAFSKEVAARCVPKPLIDFGEHVVGTGVVLVVVVYPYVGQPIGVRVKGDATSGGYAGDAFAFPIRVGSDSVYLEPDQLAMFMLPEYRRNVVLLSQIQANSGVHLLGVDPTGRQIPAQGTFFAVDVLTNVLKLDLPGRGAGGAAPIPVNVPLDFVKTVWLATDGWHIALRGVFSNAPPGFIPGLA